VIDLSKELGGHNKLIEKAVHRTDRLIQKVNRIESKMMEKEIYNYTFLQNKIASQRQMAKKKQMTTKQQDEDMVPAIFKETEASSMEDADNSDGFESCEEIEDKP